MPCPTVSFPFIVFFFNNCYFQTVVNSQIAAILKYVNMNQITVTVLYYLHFPLEKVNFIYFISFFR